MLDSQRTFLVSLILVFGLVAEPLLHDHHDSEEKVVIECLACEDGTSSFIDSKSANIYIFFEINSWSKIEVNSKRIQRGSYSRAPPHTK
tara:strand:+ start:380 stop:646 length:267 start_codon:yes stop_codon:yes gene_type:complete